MPHQNNLSPRSRSSHAGDAALAAWLDDSPQPGSIAVIWRLRLAHARAAALLTELQRADTPVSATGVVEERSVWLYLWQHRSVPGLHQRLLIDDPNVILVDAEQIIGQGEMLRLCRTWFSPDDQQHAGYLKPFTRSRLRDRNRQGVVVNVQGTNTYSTSLPRRGFYCNTTV